MKKILLILLFLTGLGFSGTCYAQEGGRKHEKKAKTKKRGNHILTQYKSHGHADDFARGSSGRHGKFYRLFHKPKSSWTNRSTNARSNTRENRSLFARFWTKGKSENADIQAHQSTDRSRNRDHGSKSFKRRKYNRSK